MPASRTEACRAPLFTNDVETAPRTHRVGHQPAADFSQCGNASPAIDVERAGCSPGGVVVRQEPAIPRSSVLLGDGRGRTSGGAAWGNHLAKSPTLKLGLPFSTLLTGAAFLVVYLAWKATDRHVQHRQFGD
jgi:hypothetical protein